MGDARAAASSSEDAAAATVAPLTELWLRALDMCMLHRTARAVELAERALEQARRTLPPNNFVAAWMVDDMLTLRVLLGNEVDVACHGGLTAGGENFVNNAWGNDPSLKATSCERLMACCARFEAGTLSEPTPEERAFFSACADPHVPLLERLGEELLLSATTDAMHYWPTVTPQEFAVLEAGVKASLQTALSLDARGELWPWIRTREPIGGLVAEILDGALGEIGDLAPETETALRRLQARLATRVKVREEETLRFDQAAVAAWHERGAADLARHGLRTCTLPACDAKEPHPRFFKCCSRCRSVFYCSPEHQREDWPRHRRADQCTKAASS